MAAGQSLLRCEPAKRRDRKSGFSLFFLFYTHCGEVQSKMKECHSSIPNMLIENGTKTIIQILMGFKRVYVVMEVVKTAIQDVGCCLPTILDPCVF